MALHKFKSEVMDPIIKQKDAQIESLKSSINSRDHRIKNLETEVNNLARGLNDLEQYGRRQSIVMLKLRHHVVSQRIQDFRALFHILPI